MSLKRQSSGSSKAAITYLRCGKDDEPQPMELGLTSLGADDERYRADKIA